MPDITFRGRRAVSIENDFLRVTILREGGHIAELLDKESGINPLWVPSWPSIEPSSFDAKKHPEFGDGVDAKLLAGIMGHNLCLDIFGGPSEEEAVLGLTPHGESSVAAYETDEHNQTLRLRAHFPLAQIRFERYLHLDEQNIRIREIVENLASFDRPIAWTQHVTLGPPFVERGLTQFRVSATRSKVFETNFGADDYLRAGVEFDWPMAPCSTEGKEDLRVVNRRGISSAYTTHLMNPESDISYFVAFHPQHSLAMGYVWKQKGFSWMGIWEENCSRKHTPWLGQTLVRGMEFGVSPMPESRRQMVNRNRLFDVPTYRWLPAKSHLEVEYFALVRHADRIPDSLEWPA